jgi:hypothetical protein
MASRLDAKSHNESVVLNAVEEWYKGHAYGPSFRDLASMTGLSVGGLFQICRQLRDSGKLMYEDAVARSIRVK